MSTYKLKFAPLNFKGDNYMNWEIKVERHLDCKGLNKILLGTEIGKSPGMSEKGDSSKMTEEEKLKAEEEFFIKKSKALTLIMDHIDDTLQLEYRNVKDPKVLWDDLKRRFGFPDEILLPAALDEWNKLRFQDFKSVSDYNSALYRIVSQLEQCGKQVTEGEKLEKTFSTFPASHILLQEQYRMRGYTRYTDLIHALLMAEKNNEILLKNHQQRPTGTMAFPEINATTFNKSRGGSARFKGRWGLNRVDGRGRGKFNGRNHFRGRGRGRGYVNNFRPQRNDLGNKTRQGKYIQEEPSKNRDNSCYRCGKKGHWSKACRTPEYLCKRYKASQEEKGKEVNFNEIAPEDGSTYLEAADFVEGENEMNMD